MKKYQYYVIAASVIILFFCSISCAERRGREKPRTWLCYYGDTFGFRHYAAFDLVVFDGRNHPPLKRRNSRSPLYLGYLSLGEIDEADPLWSRAEGRPYLIKKNNNWNSWIVDIRDPVWQSLLFDHAIRDILAAGFDGLFIDTIDSSLSLQLSGTEAAVLHIIETIRTRYPGKLLAVNRGLPVLPRLAPFLDFIVVEDLYSWYSFDEHRYMTVTRETRDILLGQVADGLKVAPDLTVLTIDYAGPGQSRLAEEAIAFSRSKGFIPYVSTYTLDQIFYHTLQH